ncbi:MAG: hypothetical protein Q9192_006015 [Flavoplaca navasiana]
MISYDHDQIFKQKTDYARDLGFSGTMDRAVDQNTSGPNDAYFGAAFFEKSLGLPKKSLAAQCWPTYSFGSGPQSVIRDHGFRVGHGDPLFASGGWPAQDYKEAPKSAAGNPTNVNSAVFVKKRWGMEMS